MSRLRTWLIAAGVAAVAIAIGALPGRASNSTW